VLKASGVTERDDLVADRDPAVRDDVGVQAGAVDEFLDDPGPGHLLEVQAGLGVGGVAEEGSQNQQPRPLLVHARHNQRALDRMPALQITFSRC